MSKPPVPPFRCRHDAGSYPAEKVDVDGVLTWVHYRCNRCHIILETRRVK